ncbi:hypothetical protein O3M35_005044 [Rhynocoris fuscipes]|uniref:Large ribosomal subunit protein uL10m n=1 Tax=Rhynocoris fuscipes TaxID=488301 RepID=A0AAW1DH99_9HEMI
MSVVNLRECMLRVKWSPAFCAQRFKRINVQRPKAPHFERAKYLALLRPQFKEDPSEYLPPSLKCRKKQELEKNTVREENPFEKILAKEMFDLFEKSKLVAFLHRNPILGEDEFQAKIKFKRENMDIRVYSRHTAKLAFEGTRYEPVLKLFVTHNSLVLSDEPNVAKLMQILKKIPQYILLAAIVDNRLLSVSQLETYVRLKDLTTARAQFAAVLNNAAQNVVMRLNQQQTTLITRLQQIVDAKSNSESSKT